MGGQPPAYPPPVAVHLSPPMLHEITIRAVLNGFHVKVGCQSLAFESRKSLLTEPQLTISHGSGIITPGPGITFSQTGGSIVPCGTR